MLITYANDVKIYNLSAGKSLPEWLSERKRRNALKKNVELRRRIELIQDFDMPDASHCINVTADGNYIFVAGTYKPRLRCYDVRDLSMKFERCLDSDVVKMQMLTDGYEKIVMLEEDRWLEFHVQEGHYYKLRIPKFGRDFSYIESAAEIYTVGVGPDIYRLNLELGQFMPSLTTCSTSLLSCDVSSEHYLFVCGTSEGKLEAWDPRVKNRVAMIDCLPSIGNDLVDGKLGISCLKFKNSLHLAVGTESGQVLLYDVRSSKPYAIKDHLYGRPIKSIAFNSDPQVVLSMDTKILKMWHENDARPYTAIEPNVRLNDLCVVPNTGLMFMANDGRKVLTYYVPSLGPAPRWCSFLDSITEELEETVQTEGTTVFDDYKFVTVKDLDELGLSNLIGTSLLRAYMHGYFIDARLYKKTRDMLNPFAFDDYRKQKIRENLEAERKNRVAVKKLPTVNKELAERLMMEEEEAASLSVSDGKKKRQRKEGVDPSALLKDDRFKDLFVNKDYQIDPQSDEFQLMNPALVRVQKMKREKLLRRKEKRRLEEQAEERAAEAHLSNEEEEEQSNGSSVEEDYSASSEDNEIAMTLREAYKEMKMAKRRGKAADDDKDSSDAEEDDKFDLIELSKQPNPFDQNHRKDIVEQQKAQGLSMEERLNQSRAVDLGQRFVFQRDREMVVQLGKEGVDRKEKKMADHYLERTRARRSIESLRGRKKATMKKLI